MKTTPRDTEKAALIRKTRRITGLSMKQVRRVIEGENENEAALSVYMLFQEGNDALMEEARKVWKSTRMGYTSSPNRKTRQKAVA